MLPVWLSKRCLEVLSQVRKYTYLRCCGLQVFKEITETLNEEFPGFVKSYAP